MILYMGEKLQCLNAVTVLKYLSTSCGYYSRMCEDACGYNNNMQWEKKITDEFFTNLIVSGKPYPGKIWLSSIHAVYHTFSKSHHGQNYFTHGRLVKD